jgi:hypothetical protein
MVAVSAVEIDVLVALMLAFSAVHAWRTSNFILIPTFALYSLATEWMSIRVGGTHCHAAGIANVSDCSSVNSVLYYVPWMYTCLISGQALAARVLPRPSVHGAARTLHGALVTAAIVGALQFGFCGVYEMQGPTLRLWRWPDAAGVTQYAVGIRNVVHSDSAVEHAAASSTDTFASYASMGLAQHTITHYFPAGPPARDHNLIASPHAYEALAARWPADGDAGVTMARGFPVMAPVFHVALGFGFCLAGWLFSAGTVNSTVRGASLRRVVKLVLTMVVSWPIGLLWDLPIRLTETALPGSKLVAAPALIILAVLLPLLSTTCNARVTAAKRKGAPTATKPDYPRILFMIPLLNHAYFATAFWRVGEKYRHAPLYAAVMCVTVCSVAAHASAAFLSGGAASAGKPKGA